MASEVTIAREGGVQPLNAERNSSKESGKRAARNSRKEYYREYKDLKKNTERMPVTKVKEAHDNLVTGHVSRPNDAKKHLLYQTRTVDELHAAEFVWNHPEALRHIRKSELGESKDKTIPEELKKLEDKRGRGVEDYQYYSLKYNKRRYVVFTENIGNDYERIYHLHRKK